jgi:hypothetical protein
VKKHVIRCALAPFINASLVLAALSRNRKFHKTLLAREVQTLSNIIIFCCPDLISDIWFGKNYENYTKQMHFSSLGQSDQEKFSNVFISDTRQHEIYNLISTFKIMFISLVANKKNLKFKGPLKRFDLLHIPTNMTALNLKTHVKKIIKIYPRQGAESKMYFFSGAS